MIFKNPITHDYEVWVFTIKSDQLPKPIAACPTLEAAKAAHRLLVSDQPFYETNEKTT